MKLHSVTLLAALLVCACADAATNLASTCKLASAEGGARSACTGGSNVFAEAQPGTLVRACKSTRFCPDAERVWTKFGSLAAGNWVETCTADKATDSAVTECRGATATQWGALTMVLAGGVAQAVEAEAPTDPAFPGTFTVSPDTGVSPLSVTITWDVSAFTGGSCTASGSWTGAKTLKGTQAATNLTANASYALTCSRAVGGGTATLEWTAPTQNTDGSALINLAGFRVVYGASAAALNQTIQVPNASIATYVVTNLNAGTWFFAVKAYNTAGAESAASNVASKTIGASTETRSATRTVTVTPAPPKAPVLQVVQADVFNASADYNILAFKPLKKYGTAELGTPCDAAKPICCSYFPVAVAAVRWDGSGRTAYPVARCELQ